MLILLTSIQLDVVEMVIAISKDYDLFKELKKLLPKLNNEDKVARINDKLCSITKDWLPIYYIVNNRHHREYDKPYSISDVRHQWGVYNKSCRNNDMPYLIKTNGDRFWSNNEGYAHRDHDYPREISSGGYHEWCLNGTDNRNSNNPILVYGYNRRFRINDSRTYRSPFEYI